MSAGPLVGKRSTRIGQTPGGHSKRIRIAIIGGGLAGMSAAHSLVQAFRTNLNDREADISGIAGSSNPEILLLESRRTTGGRAGSFIDPQTGECVDYCQHVAMGCCTNLISMMDQCGLNNEFSRYRQLNFHHPRAPVSRFVPSEWLPPPFHLMPTLGALSYLTPQQRREIRRGTFLLMRTATDALRSITAGRWLSDAGQSPETIRDYWDVVIVSALGETSAAVAMSAARKVFVDGFLAARGASDVLIPRRPLSELFGTRLPDAIARQGVQIRTQTAVRSIDFADADDPTAGLMVQLGNMPEVFDHVIVAVPWHQISRLIAPSLAVSANLRSDVWTTFPASPISGVHLWFDRAITDAPHAVMVGTLSQWLFARPDVSAPPGFSGNASGRHYYQVVISASSQVRQMGSLEVIDRVIGELREAFPDARAANLVASRLVTDPQSVFSIRPEVDSQRPTSSTALTALHLAGDFIQTGWPATMEGAIISGRQAANSLLHAEGRPGVTISAGLPLNWLTRRLIRP